MTVDTQRQSDEDVSPYRRMEESNESARGGGGGRRDSLKVVINETMNQTTSN